MPPQVGSRRSLIVSLVLTIAIAFGSLAATLSLGWGPKLGLDLAGGLSVVYKPATHATTADMQEVVTILTNRVDGLGVSGATVNLQGKEGRRQRARRHHAREVSEGRRTDRAVALSSRALSGRAVGTKAKTVCRRAAASTLPDGPKPTSTCSRRTTSMAAATNPPDPPSLDIKTTQPRYDNPKERRLLPLLGQQGQFATSSDPRS
jgi:preprotein translocase subunit SecD